MYNLRDKEKNNLRIKCKKGDNAIDKINWIVVSLIFALCLLFIHLVIFLGVHVSNFI
jgi:hypothetical protein